MSTGETGGPQAPQPPQAPYPGQPLQAPQGPYPGQAPQPPQGPQGPVGSPPPKNRGSLILILSLAILLVLIIGGGGYLVARRNDARPQTSTPSASPSEPRHRRSVNVSFRPGETRTYNMNMNMTGTIVPSEGATSATSWDMNARGKTTITGLEELQDGSARIRVTYSGVQMNGMIGGAQTSLDQAPASQEFTIAPDGSVKTADGVVLMTGEGLPSPLGASAFKTNSPVPVLPDHDINPGDTWEGDVTVPTTSGKPLVVRTQSKFENYQETKWGRAAKIWTVASTSVTGARDVAGNEMSMDGTSIVSTRYLVLPDSGQVVKTWVDGAASDYTMSLSGDASKGVRGVKMNDNFNGSWELEQ